MRIYTTCRLRFTRPGVTLLKTPDAPTGGEGSAQIIAEQQEFTQAFFETEPNKFQDVPDWIRDERLFKLALRDGSAEIVESPAAVAVKAPEPAPAPEDASSPADLAALDASQQKAKKSK